ncbi:MAG: glycosyltransferase [Bacteroidales bacterium]|nr:glycosyltransferase [Bacteroidales bacterium]
MADNPLVSIIIPVYNMAAYLQETLSSVAATDYPCLEVVIVDDGSTDKSSEIARDFCQKDPRFHYCRQDNAGVAAARNHALRLAQGRYILPVDGDDLIHPDYIPEAVDILEQHPEVKVVYARAEFFGDKQGEWHLPTFSLHRLAMHNQIYVSAVYRREEALQFGGYCEQLSGREDWDFWISMLKYGGEVRKLEQVRLYYRIRPHSKRISDRQGKRERIALLNARHPDFFQQELHGPLRQHRNLSPLINRMTCIACCLSFQTSPHHHDCGSWICLLPWKFAHEGELIHEGRNTLKRVDVQADSLNLAEQSARQKATGRPAGHGRTLVVKSFQRPVWIRRLLYGWIVKSKARRSFEYALRLMDKDIATPAPIGYVERRRWGLLQDSYYVSLASTCPYTMNDLIGRPEFPHRDEYLNAVARFTARMHEAGIRHADYSCGNILFGMENGRIRVEIIDLNRLHFGTVGQKAGCRNFERINIDRAALSLMARSYAQARGFDEETCIADIIRMRWKKHARRGITHLDD